MDLRGLGPADGGQEKEANIAMEDRKRSFGLDVPYSLDLRICQNPIPFAFTRLCPGHSHHKRRSEVIAPGGVPIEDLAKVRKGSIRHHWARAIGNVIEQ